MIGDTTWGDLLGAFLGSLAVGAGVALIGGTVIAWELWRARKERGR